MKANWNHLRTDSLKFRLPAVAHAELFQVFGFRLVFLRFGVGVSIFEFFCVQNEMFASFGATRRWLTVRLIRSLLVKIRN